MSDILGYSIVKEWLEGTVGNEKFSMRAWSGGGRGRLGGGAEHTAASYDVFRKETDPGTAHIHGGPIPPGAYICYYLAHHRRYGECIFLQQTVTSLIDVQVKGGLAIRFYNRDGFFIHGRGKHGSDGCIVPENQSARARLNKALKKAGKGTVMLKVS
jgi:hypothetical protein